MNSALFSRLFSRIQLWCGLALALVTLACFGAEESSSDSKLNRELAPPPMATDPAPPQAPTNFIQPPGSSFTPETMTNALLQQSNSPAGVDPSKPLTGAALLAQLQSRLEIARHYRHMRQPQEAEPILIDLLARTSPQSIQQQALLELALTARDQNDLTRAQQIYSQYLTRWPNDVMVPEILLRQGQLFRQMGLNSLALAKFYSVMTSALVLKNDMFNYYERLVLLAQTEIAETSYLLGKYPEAAEFFTRLLKQNNPALNRSATQFRLVRSLSALNRNEDTVGQAQDFLLRYPDAPEKPEVRFHLALALKQLGRNNDALQQVLLLLQEERSRTKDHPELWVYWQQRAGNEIGNQLYREGDYARALEIYINLKDLDPKPSWQLPISYQIGLTYERLSQPQKALETYKAVAQREEEVGTNATPGLKAIFEMAHWRCNFIQWQNNAEQLSRAPAAPTLPLPAPTTTAAAPPQPAPANLATP